MNRHTARRRCLLMLPLLAGGAAALVAVCLPLPARGSDRFVVWRSDGSHERVANLSGWPLPDTAIRPARTSSDRPPASVRLVADRRAALSRRAPYLLMANGDVLCGTPTHLEPDGGQGDLPPRLHVHLEPPLAPVAGTGITVRPERVQRIVVAGDDSGPRPPGTAILTDGRRLVARSIRWRSSGLDLLTEGGIVEAAFSELADVTFPRVDVAAAVLDDNLWAGDGGIARLQTDGGAVLTAALIARAAHPDATQRRGASSSEPAYLVQPAWAGEPLVVPESAIRCCGYRSSQEAPLSLFPAETIANRRLIGHPQPWLANRSTNGGLLAAANLQSDLGIATHAESVVAFELPPGAMTLELWVGLDRSAGEGGCVRCKVLADGGTSQSRPLWDSGILTGRDGARPTGPVDVRGLSRVILATEFAHDDRPPGADPLDIRDAVVWLAPLVTLDPAIDAASHRALAILPGASEWELAGEGWGKARVGSRLSASGAGWESMLVLPKGSEVRLTRRHQVTRAADVVELLTVCPSDLDHHDFTLLVNGSEVAWHNNADRNQLRQWTIRYSRTRARDSDVESNLTDRLAYWWDLSPWRGQVVTLELVLRGRRDESEIAWRSLTVRSAIGNLAVRSQPRTPDVPLDSLEPAPAPRREQGQAFKNAVPRSRSGEPIRFLGQPFTGGYGLARDSSVSFPLKSDYRSFVAVAGCAYQVAGPVQVLIDGRVVWERAAISSLAPAEQIEIPIPPGSQLLTLQCGADSLFYGYAAFAEAGFILD